jgi:hypothetical protein
MDDPPTSAMAESAQAHKEALEGGPIGTGDPAGEGVCVCVTSVPVSISTFVCECLRVLVHVFACVCLFVCACVYVRVYAWTCK